MSLPTSVLASLMAAGVANEAILAACQAYDIEEEARRDRKRAKDAEHQRARRSRAKAAKQPDLFERSVDDECRYAEAAIAEEIAQQSQSSQQSQSDKRNPHKENTSSLRSSEVSGGGSAGARTTLDALDLADELGRMAGFEPVDCPPGWCGASQTIQKFFNGGCPADVIRTAIRAELKRLSGAPPPERFGWFEKPIARAFANFQRSVPVVAVPKMEIIDGGKSYAGTRTYDNGRPRSRNMGSATDAAARLCEHFTRIAEAEERAAGRMDRQSGSNDDGGLSA